MSILAGPWSSLFAPPAATGRPGVILPSAWQIAFGTPPPPLPDDLVDAVVGLVESTLVSAGDLTWFGTGTSPGFGAAPLPYAVLMEPDEDDDYVSTSGDQMCEGHLEIHCYAATKKAARRLGDLVASALNDAPLAYLAGNHVYLRQSSRSAALDPDPAPGGGDCWDEARLFHFMYCASVG